MKVLTGTLIAGTLALLVVMTPVVGMAAEATIGADFNSAYVWRGLTFNDGFVIQPSLDVVHPVGIGFNVWGNWDVSDYDGAVAENDFSEVDLTVNYNLPIKGPVEVSVGVIEYLFPKEGRYVPPADSGIPAIRDGDTREWYLLLSGEPVDGLTLGIDSFYDTDAVNGYYMNGNIAYGMDLIDRLAAKISAAIGYASDDYASYYASGTDSGFFDWNTSLSGTYTVNDALALGAFVTYSSNVDSDVLPDDAVDVNWFGGANIYYGF